MKTKSLLWLSAAVLLMTAACANDEESSIISSLPIQFSAGITSTRVSGDAWEVNDKIGISMSGNEITAVENVPYVLQTLNGQFQAESNALQFPSPASDVTFHAYYPYSAEVASNTLVFNVDGKTDVLWAEKTVAAADQTSNTVELTFAHVLSQVTLRTAGFPDDITVTLSGNDYSQATLNIADGTVAGAGSAGTVSIPLVNTGNYEYSAIILPVSGADKTLTIQSASTGETWEYQLSSVTYDEAHKYIYTVSAGAGVVIKDNITQWIPGEPENLDDPTDPDPEPGIDPEPGTVEGEIAKLLVGKTYKPDINYFYDMLNADGGSGYTYDNGNGFGNNVEGNWKWNATLLEQSQKSSIKFYAGSNGQLLADAVDAGTAKNGITVTVDDNAKTLTFSQAPFTYTWHFSEDWVGGYVKGGTNPQPGKEGTVWMLFAQDPTYDSGSFILSQNVENVNDLFTGDKMHWGYQSQETEGDPTIGHRVINFVKE